MRVDSKGNMLDFSDPAKPRFLITRTTEEFMSVVEREKNGELRFEYLERVARHNGAWCWKILWP